MCRTPPHVTGGCCTAIFLADVDQALEVAPPQRGRRVVSRAVVDHDEFDASNRRFAARQGPQQARQLTRSVVSRDHDRHGRRDGVVAIGGACGLHCERNHRVTSDRSAPSDVAPEGAECGGRCADEDSYSPRHVHGDEHRRYPAHRPQPFSTCLDRSGDEHAEVGDCHLAPPRRKESEHEGRREELTALTDDGWRRIVAARPNP